MLEYLKERWNEPHGRNIMLAVGGVVAVWLSIKIIQWVMSPGFIYSVIALVLVACLVQYYRFMMRSGEYKRKPRTAKGKTRLRQRGGGENR